MERNRATSAGSFSLVVSGVQDLINDSAPATSAVVVSQVFSATTPLGEHEENMNNYFIRCV